MYYTSDARHIYVRMPDGRIAHTFGKSESDRLAAIRMCQRFNARHGR